MKRLRLVTEDCSRNDVETKTIGAIATAEIISEKFERTSRNSKKRLENKSQANIRKIFDFS